MISDILRYEFLQNTFIAGILIGLIAPLLGVFIVFRRMSLIADALSHVTLSGVSFGLLLSQRFNFFSSLNPIYMGMLFSVVGSLIIERLRVMYRHYQEIAIPIIMSLGVGLGVIFMSLSRGFSSSILSFLFGSLSAISRGDVWLALFVSCIVIGSVFFMYDEFIALSFDEEHAKIIGIKEKVIHFFFMFLVAVVISIAVQLVGVLLISSLMTLPIATAMKIAKSFRSVILLAIIYAEISVIAGLVISYYVDIAPGGTIVVLSVLILMGHIFYKKISMMLLRRNKSL